MRLGHHTQVMGIVNVTPDSFWDGGLTTSVDAAVERARRFAATGADWLDIGGESTGPGSRDVPTGEELRRVVPVVTALARSGPLPISVDTTKAAVAEEALAAGAVMINDIGALRWDPDMARVIARAGASVVLMYAKDDTPRTTTRDPVYDDVVETVCEFLLDRIDYARAAGIAADRIFVDPGLGWFVGADPRYSYEILHGLDRIGSLGYPILIGPSRKSFLASNGVHPPRPAAERLMPTAAAVAVATWMGVSIVRVHDVEEMAQVVGTVEAIKRPGSRAGSAC
ncbi:MAG: dihydropteroate synthase [Nitrospirae bacterium]|nr:dihydropteroate synthase [Nitrospirota bacterium]